jgi:hypothetical protein
MERPRDRDFVETVEGLFFCVVGYLHPADRYTAYLKYVPEPGGKWRRGDVSYARVIPFYHVSQVEGTYGFLEAEHPGYLFDCPVRNITVSSVPVENVKAYYRPRERLKSIFEGGPRDDLEYKLVDLVTILSGLSGVDVGELGVTGSILTSSHSPEFSDMDLTVYGMEASKRLKRAILDMREEHNVIQPFSVAKKELWSESRSGRFPLDFRAFMEFAERRWNYGIYSDTYFSIHPVRSDDEMAEAYGDNVYTQHGETEGVAVISDNEESIYLPAIYRVEQATAGEAEITRIVSYESLFSDMFDTGDRVEYRGILEKVTGKDDYSRVVVGGAGSAPSYIRRTY